MKTVLFISKSETAASTRYRALNYFPYLREAGWQPIHMKVSGSLVDRIKCLQLARKVDVVVVVRRTYDVWFRWLLRRAARRLIFDFDDAIYLHNNNLQKNKRRKQFNAMLCRCDQAWCGNEHLADQARPFCADAHVVPTTVDVDAYDKAFDKPQQTTDLVWIGSKSTQVYLQNILPDLEEAARQLPTLRLKIIADFSLSSSVLNIQPIAWQSQTEVMELATSHIGLAPLTDDPWTHGKCGLKVLQYMACKLPVVSNRAGVNEQIVLHGQTGYLVDEQMPWSKAIVDLANNSQLRTQMGQAGYQRVRQDYDIQAVAKRMIRYLSESS